MTEIACVARASENRPPRTWVGALRRVGRAGRGALAAVAAAAALLSPASSASGQLLVNEVAEPVRIEIETGSDLMAYDLCWADDAAAARGTVARRVASEMNDPASLYVIALPELSPDWRPLKLGLPRVRPADDGASGANGGRARRKTPPAPSTVELEDAKGRPIDLRAVRQGKLQYERHVEDALVDVVERVREERPNAVLSVEGFAADRDYERLVEKLDFSVAEGGVASRTSGRSGRQRRKGAAGPIRPDLGALRESGMDLVGSVAFELDGRWYVASEESLPDSLVALDEGTTRQWEENIRREQNSGDAPGNPSAVDSPVDHDGADVDTHANDDAADDGDDPGSNLIPPADTDDADDDAADDSDDGDTDGAADDDATDDADGDGRLPDPGGDDSADDDGADDQDATDTDDGADSDDADDDPGDPPADSDSDDSDGDADDASDDSDDSDDGEDDPGVDAAALGSAPAMGVNLDFLNYWTRQWVYVDVMKIAMPWVTQNHRWISGGENPWDSESLDHMTLDENGYPIGLPVEVPGTDAPQIVATLIYRSAGGHYPAGRYVCLYDGTGSIQFGLDATTVSESPGRIEVDVNPTNRGILLKIAESDPNDHVRNVRLIMPGFEETYEEQLFHPEFLSRLDHFEVIRFLNWQMINGSDKERWSDRVSPTNYTQGGPRGASLEHMIELCNRLDADPWMHIPHLVDDDYIRRLASMLRDRLDPELTVYIEYSNEVWNGNFGQSQWAQENGVRMSPDLDPNRARNRFYAKRVAEVMEVFAEAFGDDDRLVRVIASQHNVPWQAENILGYFTEFEGEADALAVAPYFGGKLGSFKAWRETATKSVDEILDLCAADIVDRRDKTRRNAATAAEHGMPLIAYEGGQHLVGVGPGANDERLTRKFIAANRHERMRDLYLEDMRGWAEAGGGLFVTLSFIAEPTKWGSWGLLESQEQPESEAPKWRAVTRTAEEWSGAN